MYVGVFRLIQTENKSYLNFNLKVANNIKKYQSSDVQPMAANSRTFFVPWKKQQPTSLDKINALMMGIGRELKSFLRT